MTVVVKWPRIFDNNRATLVAYRWSAEWDIAIALDHSYLMHNKYLAEKLAVLPAFFMDS